MRNRSLVWAAVCGLSGYVLLVGVSHVAPFITRWQRGALYALALALTTGAPLGAWYQVARFKKQITSSDTEFARQVAIVFAFICVLARPIAILDFWYYIAVGRIAANGGNVYLDSVSSRVTDGLPLIGYTDGGLVYGPVWALVSSALGYLGNGSLIREFVLFKGLTLAPWLLVLQLVARTEYSHASQRLTAILLYGWLPVSVWQSVGEGHNDIVMVAGVSLWLARPQRAWAIVPSLLVKYVSAPMLVLAVANQAAHRTYRQFAYLAAAGVVGLMIVAWHWQDGAMIAGLFRISGYAAYTPVAAIRALEDLGSLPARVAALAIVCWRLALGILIGWYGWQHLTRRTHQSLVAWAATVWIALMWGLAYTTPWYVIWVLPSVLMAGDVRLLVLTLPMFVVFPFAQVRGVAGLQLSLEVTTLFLYAAVWIWWLTTLGILRARRHLIPLLWPGSAVSRTSGVHRTHH